MRKLERLPVFPHPAVASQGFGDWELRVEGLVRRCLTLRLKQIGALPVKELAAPFHCEEGWEVQGLRWTGVPLAQVVDLASPLAEARYVAVGSGQFVALLELSRVGPDEPLLAYRLDGRPLPAEHGGPLRLVMGEGPCYRSVKWVDRLELREIGGGETAKEVALGRIGRPNGAGGSQG